MANESSSITHKVDEINEEAEKLKEIASGANVALTEMRLQFETMMEIQKEERLERERMYNEEKEHMRKRYGRIILGLILTICLILGSFVGGAIYLFTNFDIAFGTYIQKPNVGGDGNSTIYDGIHFNAD